MIIAYHIYPYGEYKRMVKEQFDSLINSGLYDACNYLYVGIIQTSEDIKWIYQYLQSIIVPGKNIFINVYQQNNEIADTMRWVAGYAKQNPDEQIMFFHTKGVTKYSEPTEDWRKYMEYFVIDNWQLCIEKLKNYDCCGVMWNSDTVYGNYPHFSGAFWWANASYLNTLSDELLNTDWIYGREFWIGSNTDVKVCELHNSHMNDKQALLEGHSHYSLPYKRDQYELSRD
jgi:hypothetical protein